MSPLKFKAMGKRGDAYEVRRDGVLLGQVLRVEMTKSVIGTNRARLSLVVRWNYRVEGIRITRGPYLTRQKAAEVLASQYDAHQRAKAVAP
ncbi:hypothetical protein Mx9_p46 [Myxococcus phage Mx9]|nr:Orf4 [Myxococcus phage Mx9]WFG54153.1 hypothetical protein Mx9_p46 [Myxococcus phage Mx9]